LGWQIDGVRVREIRLLSGMMRTLGLAAGVLGIIDLLQNRKSKLAIEQSHALEPATGPDSNEKSSPPAR
jgi:hypothetical protein